MDYFTEMKIGQLANTVFRTRLLDEKRVTTEEIEQLLSLENRDISKYKLDGVDGTLNKGKLAFAVV